MVPLLTLNLQQFVIDGTWTTDHTAPQENDGASNINNVLTPDRITKKQSTSSQPTTAIMSGVTPASTTSNLAGNVPKELSREMGTGSSDLPGAFPETPANEISDLSVNPIPATSGIGNPVHLAPGEKVPDSSTLTTNTLSSTAHDDVSLSKAAEDSQRTFGVAPLPATSGMGNPIHLQPGEKVPDPSTFTNNTVNSTVRTDRESYENTSGVPQLPDVVTPAKERAAKGGMFNIPGLSNNMIPESSLPMGGVSLAEKDRGFNIQSAGAGTTTAALAGSVPLEPRGVPEVVRESQQEAGVAPEASGNREVVKEKTAMEKELESKVSEAPPIHEGTPHIQSVGEKSTTAALADGVPLEPKGVPEVVRESQREAGFAPEASANPEAVAEKTETEKELENKVPEEQPIHSNNIQSAGANSTTAALAGNVPLESRGVPEVVSESQQEAGVAPEASSNPEAVGEKSEVEKELEGKVPEAPATSDGSSGHMGAMLGGGIAAGGVAAAAVGYAARQEKPAEGSSFLGSRGLPASIQQSIDEMNKSTPIAPTVPDVVQESITAAYQSPEAAASQTIVGEKSAVESELLNKLKTENDVGAPAPSSSAALTETAPAVTSSIKEMNRSTPMAPTVPDVVQESIAAAHQSPEAAASQTMVVEKRAMESELLNKVKTENDVGAPAPSSSAALMETAPAATSFVTPASTTFANPAATSSTTPAAAAAAAAPSPASEPSFSTTAVKSTPASEPSSSTAAAGAETGAKTFHAPLASTATPAQPTFQSAMSSAVKQQPSASDSRDVSPMSHPTTTKQSQPATTTGVGSSSAPQTSAASPQAASSPNPASFKAASSPNPSTATGASTASGSTDKKSKRASGFFGKLKSKFSDKHKE